MRRYWASLSNETRIRIGGRISQSLTGKVQSEAHLRANSEGHRGKVLSEGTRRKLSDSLILAYAEGRKQPVRSSHRRGARHTEEAKAKIREARARQVMWNKGVKTGPMPREVVEKRAASQRGKPHAITQAVLAGRVRMIEKKRGRKAIRESKKDLSAGPDSALFFRIRKGRLLCLSVSGSNLAPVLLGNSTCPRVRCSERGLAL